MAFNFTISPPTPLPDQTTNKFTFSTSKEKQFTPGLSSSLNLPSVGSSTMAASTTSTGGLFGQPQQQQPKQGLFGSAVGGFGQQPNAGGGLFGGQQQQQQPSGLFGSTSQQQPAGGGVFGSNAGKISGGSFGIAQPQQQQQSSIFGNTAGAKPQQTTNLFGSGGGTGGGMFGASQQQQQQPSGFFGQQPLQLQQQQQQQYMSIAQSQLIGEQQRIEQQFKVIVQSLNPTDANNPFRYVLYNVGAPGVVYARDNMDEATWAKAIHDNPDPTRFVPVLAVGFDQLKERVKLQDEMATVHERSLKTIEDDIVELQQRHEVNTLAKIEEHRRRHLELSHRALRVMAKLEAIRRNGKGVTAEEENLARRLERIHDEYHKPTQLRGQLNELMSQARLQQQSTVPRANRLQVVEQESLESVHAFLLEQHKALKSLTTVLRDDVEDVAIMDKGYA